MDLLNSKKVIFRTTKNSFHGNYKKESQAKQYTIQSLYNKTMYIALCLFLSVVYLIIFQRYIFII